MAFPQVVALLITNLPEVWGWNWTLLVNERMLFSDVAFPRAGSAMSS